MFKGMLTNTTQLINWIAIGCILLACGAMQLVLRHGLSLGGAVEDQMAFITEYRVLWQISWFTWNLAVIGLFIFSLSLYQLSDRTGWARIGLGLVFIGMVADIWAEYTLSFQLSEYAELKAANAFLMTEARAILITGTYAQGCCNLGGLLITLSLYSHDAIPKPIGWLGLVSWSMGIVLSCLMAIYDMAAMGLFTAVTLLTSLAFMVIVNTRCFTNVALLR